MSESKGRGIDWMYQSASSKAELKKNEEESYLLGKEYNPKSVKTGDLAVGQQQASVGISRIVDGATGGGGFHHQPDKNEAFLMKHEDPMFMVNQTRKEKERDRRKKKELFDKASTDYGDRHSSSSRRGRSSSRRSSRKDRRRDRSLSTSSSSSDDDDYERRSSSGRRKRKKEKKRKKKRHRSYSTDSEDSKDRRRRRRKHSRKKEKDRDEESRSRSPSPHSESRRRSKKHSKRERSESDDRHRHHNHDRRRDEPSNQKITKNENNDHQNERKSYGLIGSTKTPITSTDSLGPDKALLEKKRREKEEARNRYRRRDRDRHRDGGMTEEEKRAKLNAMQNDGNDRAERLSKAKNVEKVDLHDEEIQRRMKEGSKEVSTFVQDLVMKTHGIHGDDGLSLAKQLQQNRNYIQKASDDNFL